ncbi:MAG: hypothetical protein COA78_28355 [Blastopirellula sp.]|nr:MAG: hypothetical protein COA78_28355 [Blastopirellula sp.]
MNEPVRRKSTIVRRLGSERGIGLLIPVILAISMLAFTIHRNLDYWRLDTLGATALATIIDKIEDRSIHEGKISIRYAMRVGFTVGDTMRRGSVGVTRAFFHAHDEGARIPIRYMPLDPQIRDIDPDYRGSLMYNAIWIAAFFVGIGVYNFLTLKPAN